MMNYSIAEKIFKECSLDYSKELHEKLEIYCDFLLEYNKNVNLTAITDPEQVWLKHFADSIYTAHCTQIPQNASMIDVGTGAGFPSVPIKLYRNDIKLTLLDSLNKRVIFLEKLCERLGIKVQLIHGRAEEYGRKDEYREKFDAAAARAVAAMPVLCEYCLPFVKADEGIFIALKGQGEPLSSYENAVVKLGGTVADIFDYSLNDNSRSIITIKKISHTPTKYPRNSGQIKNKPL